MAREHDPQEQEQQEDTELAPQPAATTMPLKVALTYVTMTRGERELQAGLSLVAASPEWQNLQPTARLYLLEKTRQQHPQAAERQFAEQLSRLSADLSAADDDVTWETITAELAQLCRAYEETVVRNLPSPKRHSSYTEWWDKCTAVITRSQLTKQQLDREFARNIVKYTVEVMLTWTSHPELAAAIAGVAKVCKQLDQKLRWHRYEMPTNVPYYSRQPRTVCQLCQRPGHTAPQCYELATTGRPYQPALPDYRDGY